MCHRALRAPPACATAPWRDVTSAARGTALHIPPSAASISARPVGSCSATRRRHGRQPLRAAHWELAPTTTERETQSQPSCSAAASAASVAASRAAAPAGADWLPAGAAARASPAAAAAPAAPPPTPPQTATSCGHPAPPGPRCREPQFDPEPDPGEGAARSSSSSSSSGADPGAGVQGWAKGRGGGALPRRSLLAAAAAAVAAAPAAALGGTLAGATMLVPGPVGASQRTSAQCRQAYAPFLVRPDFSGPGPLAVARLPRREHTCTSCFPACVNASCTLRVEVVYPKGGPDLGLGPPFPLAVFSAGFLLGSESYMSYAERLASWGYTVLMYDRNETVASLLDDAACVRLLVELIDWAAADPLLRRLADPGAGVYMVGHSRGGKLAALAGAEDARVAALCLIDPVDNTVYAPLAPGFPSALAALRNMPGERPLPLAVVGGGLGGDCAPRQANYRRFFAASSAPSWEVAIPEAGHFQFLDSLSGLQRALCPTGEVDDEAVRAVGLAVMVAWGESMVRHRGADIFRLPVPYPSACQHQQQPQQPQQQPQQQQEQQQQAPSSAFPGPSPRPLPLPQLAQQLQQRQGLKGQASLAQAAYAAAAVLQQNEDLDLDLESDEGQVPERGADIQVQKTQIRDWVGDRERGEDATGAAAWDRGGVRGQRVERAGGATAAQGEGVGVLSLPPAEAAASSRVKPGNERREPPRSASGGGGGVGGGGGGGERAVVVQEALRSGLDRMVTRLQYDTGLRLETRYKYFDDEDEGVRRSLYGEWNERQWPEGLRTGGGGGAAAGAEP
ncbi:hypothetical protein PLESTB_000800700 [Pleodorina starrii]|uniref:Chlorophyllase n=1 Tax=Pleodorina starrii TaxID=330485 RepID=A0A9W6BLE2_9CHLO|nr:hypothetical protein PLESTB_000800700 [Pleodorina starrii]